MSGKVPSSKSIAPLSTSLQSGQQVKETELGKAQSDVKGTADSSETQASTAAASAAVVEEQFAKANLLKATLEQIFGAKIGDAAFNILCAKAKQGINLSFDVVKQAVLDAAKGSKEVPTNEQFSKLQQAFVKEQATPRTQAPGVHAEINYVTTGQMQQQQMKTSLATDRLINKLKDVIDDAQLKQEMIKIQGLKDKDKQRDNELQMTSKLRDPKRNV